MPEISDKDRIMLLERTVQHLSERIKKLSERIDRLEQGNRTPKRMQGPVVARG